MNPNDALLLAFKVQQAVLFRGMMPTEKEPTEWHKARAKALGTDKLDRSNDPLDFVLLAAQDAFDAVILGAKEVESSKTKPSEHTAKSSEHSKHK